MSIKFKEGEKYLITMLDGSQVKAIFVGEDPGNVMKFKKENGKPFTVPTGGFTEAKETK